ncbi:MAG: RluA family pseudouridine synthase [Bacteroidetes bacterium HGW-Bacteroidetes-6]|jgi:RluA family pseudouridine synthase|nr:MAG: RluA family pseudouridine synthase [Bacteroidetes bacterium HGW-Bacteroidetes-6]
MKKDIPKTQLYQVKQTGTILEFLEGIFPEKSKTNIRQMLKHRTVFVNGNSVSRADHRIIPGQSVEIGASSSRQPDNLFGIPVLFEDESIVVVDKPAGLLTVGTEKEKTNTAYSLLSGYVKTQHKSNKIFIVHRLDRDTSGILVFARNTDIRDILQERWHNENHRREYAALVCGKVTPPEGIIESWLKENANLQMYSSPREGDGQHAITQYSLNQQNNEFSLLKVIPETGRRNQIRVHLSDIGFPIVGDRRYGKGINPIGRLGLHATMLLFQHPVSGKTLKFESNIPTAFLRWSKP